MHETDNETETQTDMERLRDTPRLQVTGDRYAAEKKVDPSRVKTLFNIINEHNREPGVFDYNYGQNFYSHNADIDQEAYLVVGAGRSHYAHSQNTDGNIETEKSRRTL